MKSAKVASINLWNQAAAVLIPMGKDMYSYNPNSQMKAVNWIDQNSTGIWWYAAFKSIFEKMPDSLSRLYIYAIFGKGYASCLITLLSGE